MKLNFKEMLKVLRCWNYIFTFLPTIIK